MLCVIDSCVCVNLKYLWRDYITRLFVLLCSGTWRRWLKAPFLCCHPTMITALNGQKRPSSRFTCWRCWTSRRRGLKSGWCALSSRWPHLLHHFFPLSACSDFSLVSSAQHGYYSRTVVLRLLERKYKSLVSDSVGDRYVSPPLFVLGSRRQLRSQNKDEGVSLWSVWRAAEFHISIWLDTIV